MFQQIQSIARPQRRTAFNIESGVIGMALFLMAEAMLFAGLISAHLLLRSSAAQWPPAGQPRLPVEVTLVNTLVLLLSGAVLWQGRGRSGAVKLAAALGALFFAIQGYEWVRLISFGLTASSGPFGGMFYALIGLHGLHVLGGLAALLTALRKLRGGDSAPLRVAPTYRTFVVAVWPVLFLVVYL